MPSSPRTRREPIDNLRRPHETQSRPRSSTPDLHFRTSISHARNFNATGSTQFYRLQTSLQASCCLIGCLLLLMFRLAYLQYLLVASSLNGSKSVLCWEIQPSVLIVVSNNEIRQHYFDNGQYQRALVVDTTHNVVKHKDVYVTGMFFHSAVLRASLPFLLGTVCCCCRRL